MTPAKYLTQLLKGNTDVLILSLLAREAMYGHQIMEELEQSSRGFFRVSEGTLYPALYRLAREGYIRGRWSKLPTGQERKFYSLTRKGERRLDDCRSMWSGFAAAMDMVTARGA
ncbi:MAG TPA: helix-turn-helix transcriptional regulator [Dehalococcoidia bacterium]|nr:helix-turn-helix transcriptional regulator [Dehalococcoidia bacterium]